jgi:hypothetical protein
VKKQLTGATALLSRTTHGHVGSVVNFNAKVRPIKFVGHRVNNPLSTHLTKKISTELLQ